jgi:pyruvate kinase
MCDLQGPKIRIGKFKDGKVTLEAGASFTLHATCEQGDGERVGLDYKELPRDVEEGAVLLLDDGKIVLEVTAVRGEEVHTRVRHGGVLSNNKGINRQGGGLTAAALTPKDMEDIRTAAKIHADFLAVSFPKSGADMYMARELLRAAGGKAMLIAKIERAEAVKHEALVSIMGACDGIMVARGDLAVEVGDAAVPALQKRMIRLAREHNKLTITATQMMESMIVQPSKRPRLRVRLVDRDALNDDAIGVFVIDEEEIENAWRDGGKYWVRVTQQTNNQVLAVGIIVEEVE